MLSPRARFGLAPLAGAVLVLLLHTLLVFHFEPPSVFLGERAVEGGDFDTHYGQVSRFVDAMDGWGQIWSYDPSLLAGRPAGVLFDCDTKAWNVWTYALHLAGVSRGRAFNLFVVVGSLLVPLIALAAGWLVLRRAWGAVLVALLASLVWSFDSQTHFFWWIGMIAWTLGSVLALLPLALFARYVEAPRLGSALGTALSLAITLLVHPFTFFVLVVPMTRSFVAARPSLSRAA